jgi:hypothetical protein
MLAINAWAQELADNPLRFMLQSDRPFLAAQAQLFACGFLRRSQVSRGPMLATRESNFLNYNHTVELPD